MSESKVKCETTYVMSKYPTKCKECPCFSQQPYRCHNERGMEAKCSLGYMHREDMRDFYGNTRFFKCRIEKSRYVIINPDL